MPRSRNLKYDFFVNEYLGTCDPLEALFFEGLWTLADRFGRLENRPLRMKAQVFPYRDLSAQVITGYVQNLSDHGFLTLYTVDGQDYIEIRNFAKHQNPHKNEKGGDIPKPPQPPENKDIPQDSSNYSTTPVKHHSAPEESCIRNEESCSDVSENNNLASGDAPSEQQEQPKPSADKKPGIDYSSWPELPDGQILKDWLKARSKARAVHSQTAINTIGKELHKAVAMGYTVNQCGEEAATRGWRGFKADWMQGSVAPANGKGLVSGGNVTKFPGRPSVEDHNREVARRWAAGGDCYDQE